MAAITIPGENLIAQKQANNKLLAIDQFVLANIPNLDPENPVDREEQLPPESQIVLQEQVSQMGYISPNLVVYSLMLDTGGDKFDFNWIGLYASADDVVVSIAYLPTQTKDPSVAMTRNFMLEFSGAAETTDIHVDAESWQVDFSARMDGTDKRVRQLSEDTIGRQLFYGDACKVSAGEDGYYKVASGTGHVAGIRFNYVEKLVLVTKFPSSIWMDVWQRKNSMSDIQPEAVAVVSQTDRVDYTDGDGVRHYLEKVAEVKYFEIIDFRRLNKLVSVPKPDFDLPLINDINIREGFGTTNFERTSIKYYTNKSGILNKSEYNEPAIEKNGMWFEGTGKNFEIFSDTPVNMGTHVKLIDNSASDPMMGQSAAVFETISTGTPYGSIKTDIEVGKFITVSYFAKSSDIHSIGILFTENSFNPKGKTNPAAYFDLHTGTLRTKHDLITNYGIIKYLDGWYRIWATCIRTNKETNSNIIQFARLQSGNIEIGQRYSVFGVQVEELPFVSSYIRTDNFPKSRNADILTVTSKNNLPAFMDDEYTIHVTISIYTFGFDDNIGGSSRTIFQQRWTDNGISRYRWIRFSPKSRSISAVCVGGLTPSRIVSFSIPEDMKKFNITVKNSIGYSAIYLNGILKNESFVDTSSTAVIAPEDANIQIGTYSKEFLWGYLKNFCIWHSVLTNDQILLLGSSL